MGHPSTICRTYGAGKFTLIYTDLFLNFLCASVFICVPIVLSRTFAEKYDLYGAHNDHQIHENGHILDVE